MIIPARNEAPYIEDCIRSVLAQSPAEALEVVVSDGMSDDATVELARDAGAVVVENPSMTAPAGLNAALAVARGDVIVRFDAHAEMPPGYIEASLRVLDDEQGAVNVGGWRTIRPDGPWGRALSVALRSRFGVGNPRLWRPPRRRESRCDVETVPLGCFRRATLENIGGWNEAVARNEDYELNYRLRSRGGRVVFDPAIWSIYKPRETIGAIARQYVGYGRVKARVMTEAPSSIRARQLAPFALMATVAVAFSPSGRARVVGQSLLGAYALGVTSVALRSPEPWRTAAVLVTMHGAWGAGVVAGLGGIAARRFRRLPAAGPVHGNPSA